MENEHPLELSMTSPATYQIVVIGRLDKGWEDWFNGTDSRLEKDPGGKPHTRLTCRVRDQAELLGVLNRLNSLNLPLMQVTLIRSNE
jgi:hypothetical protein